MGKRTFQELTFSDSFMFAAVMEDADICQEVLELATGFPIRKVCVHPEATILTNSDYRGVRLDVYAADENGSRFNAEMQTTNKYNLPKRSRIYQGQIDMTSLKPGEDFNQLPKSFIIFICLHDPFGRGRYRYTFTARCHETEAELADGAYRIFLNTRGMNDAEVPSELVEFLKYVEDASYVNNCQKDSLVQRIDSKIREIKRKRGMEVQYMLFGELLDDERKEGQEEGQENLLHLMASMEADGDTDKIPLLWKNADFLQEMYLKYHIEA